MALGLLILLLALFHRVLFFEGTRYFVIRAAKQQHLDLTYKISGSIFTTLHIENLKGTPTESGAIQRLEIGSINLQYSLPDLVRKGSHAFLKTVEAKDVFVELTPTEKPPPEKAAQAQNVKFPALFPERLVLENVNFTSHGPTGDTVLNSLTFSLYPDAPGALKLKVLNMPGIRRWEGISAVTGYANRNLMLNQLVIGPEIELKEFNLDASRLEQKELTLHAKGRVFTSQSAVTVQITDLNKTNHLDLTVGSQGGLVLDDLWAYLNIQPPVHGRVEQMDANFQGIPTAPKSWSAQLDARLDDAVFKEQSLGNLKLKVHAAQGEEAALTLDGTWDAADIYQYTAYITPPEDLAGFKKVGLYGTVSLTLADLAPLQKLLPPDVSAHQLALNADYDLANGRLNLSSGLLQADSFIFKDLRLGNFRLELAGVSRDLGLSEGAPPFSTLMGTITDLSGKVAYGAYETDRVEAQLSVDNGRITIGKLLIDKGANHISASGNYTLPADIKSWRLQPGEVALSIQAPELQAFLAPDSKAQLVGTFTAQGKIEQTGEGKYTGQLTIAGHDIVAQGLPVRSLDGQVDLKGDRADIPRLDVIMDDRNHLHLNGNVTQNIPYDYQGQANVQFQDLAVLQPLLPVAADGAKAQIGGALTLDWSGRGQLHAPMAHTGELSVNLAKGVYAGHAGISLEVTGAYTPDTITFSKMLATADGLPQATLSVNWRQDRLEITGLSVRDGPTTLAEGSLSAPLRLAEFRDINRLFPGDEPIELKLQTRQLNFAQLLAAAKMQPTAVPATGTLTMDLKAAGTLNTPVADLRLQVSALKATNPPANSLAPAAIDLTAHLQENRLTVEGTASQPLVQPLRIAGNMPLDLRSLKEKRALDPDTPIEGAITMPRTDLAILKDLAPQVRESRGAVAIDLKASGTVGTPRYSGSVQGNLSLLRFTDPSLPPVDDLALQVAFEEKRVSLNRLTGRVAGGNFQGSGRADFEDSKNPVLDLTLGARNALVVQNDDLTLRASADIHVVGPLNTAAVTGAIYVTRSRFYKDIDILPIGLPGRPAPKPPADPKVISFPNPPLRDWTFDVAIRTADPFLIQGNMARGKAEGDLKLGGTGLAPWLEGNIHIREFTASLPFSRLEVDDGLIYFQQARPFIPLVNIRGHSTIRNYDVRAYVYGAASAPTAVFSSDPPLPQSEVVSLLATGTTTTELGSDPNALAGRGAILLFQKLYRSVFKRGAPTDSLTDNTVLENVQFDIGSTDPSTGQSGANLRIPLAKDIVLVGGVDVTGNFRGQVKYLVRFK